MKVQAPGRIQQANDTEEAKTPLAVQHFNMVRKYWTNVFNRNLQEYSIENFTNDDDFLGYTEVTSRQFTICKRCQIRK